MITLPDVLVRSRKGDKLCLLRTASDSSDTHEIDMLTDDELDKLEGIALATLDRVAQLKGGMR